MEADEYKRLAQQENELWWFDLLHRNLFAVLDSVGLPHEGLQCADFGCGTGNTVARLRERFPTWALVGLDKSNAAVAFARRNHGPHFVLGDVHRPPFKSDFFDIVFAVDVMYHREVQPTQMLQGAFSVLKPGGMVIVNNPAYEWLWSYHDQFVHAARRYTARGVAASLTGAGFTVVRGTYWNAALFPLMVLKRKFLTASASHSDVAAIPAWLNRIFSLVSLPEPWLLRYGVNLPFGGSVLAVGRKRP
jgi:SAM-dependent methyltransferase